MSKLIEQNPIEAQVSAFIQWILEDTSSNDCKVQFIKEQLAEGQYVINAHNIASKLQAFARVVEDKIEA